MLLTAICDDNPLHLKLANILVESSLKNTLEYSVKQYSNAQTLIAAVENGFKPDLAVLDIEMPGENGIELAKKLNAKLPDCRIIFLTGYIDYAPDAYEAEHIWFVVKNRAKEHFPMAVEKALSSISAGDKAAPGILVRSEGKNVLVPTSEILYIGKVGRKALIHCDYRDLYDARRPSAIIPTAAKDLFLQCHQGYWVNSDKIRELDHEKFILTNGEAIPISRTFRDYAKAKFFEKYRI